MVKKRYQDYVIKDGKFVGDFEGMYQNFEDPWLQSVDDNRYDSGRVFVKNWIKRISTKQTVRSCEIGCGFGFITSDLTKEGINCIGTDISPTAIEKAKKIHSECKFEVADFNDFEFYKKEKINVFMMVEITWYVLSQLKSFIENLRNMREQRNESIFLIHLLTTYADDAQKYGCDYFTDLEGILNYFSLNYVEDGYIVGGKEYDAECRITYFVAKI
jgi:SAM-dependent methyltransferase